MNYLIALLIFAALTTANWHASLAFYKATVPGSDPAALPSYGLASFVAVLFVTMTCFLPFLGGYPAGCLVWFLIAFFGIPLPPAKAAVLFGYLALNSLLTRLLALGVMSFLGI